MSDTNGKPSETNGKPESETTAQDGRRRSRRAADEQPPAPASEQVTYLPGEHDPPSIKWHGHTFHANVPKAVTKAELIEAARKNRFRADARRASGAEDRGSLSRACGRVVQDRALGR